MLTYCGDHFAIRTSIKSVCCIPWSEVLVTQSCLTFCDPMDCCRPDSSVHGILQARILMWVAIPVSRGSSWLRGQTYISCVSCIGRWILYHLNHQGSQLDKLYTLNLHNVYVKYCCSVTQSCPTFCDPHGLQHPRLPCPSPAARACSNSCPLSQWCYPTISSSIIPFSCLQSLPASESSLMSQLFASDGQSIGASASAPVLRMNIQDWFLLGLTDLISLQSKRLSRVFSNLIKLIKLINWSNWSKGSILQCSTFFMVQFSHPYMTTRNTILKVKVAQSCPTLWPHGLVQSMEFSRPEHWTG